MPISRMKETEKIGRGNPLLWLSAAGVISGLLTINYGTGVAIITFFGISITTAPWAVGAVRGPLPIAAILGASAVAAGAAASVGVLIWGASRTSDLTIAVIAGMIGVWPILFAVLRLSYCRLSTRASAFWALVLAPLGALLIRLGWTCGHYWWRIFHGAPIPDWPGYDEPSIVPATILVWQGGMGFVIGTALYVLRKRAASQLAAAGEDRK